MACTRCQFYITPTRQCGRVASCRTVCSAYCWQHAKLFPQECTESKEEKKKKPQPKRPPAKKKPLVPEEEGEEKKKKKRKKEETKEKKYDIGFKARIGNGYGFLSNFFPDVEDTKRGKGPRPAHSTFLFRDKDGKEWKSSEHYYQYHMYEPHDSALAAAIYQAPTSLAAKQLTSQAGYTEFKEARGGTRPKAFYKGQIRSWKKENTPRSIDIMRQALAYKFSDQNPQLRDALVATGSLRLAELGRMPGELWSHTGQNLLGTLLMERRAELVSKPVPSS